MKDELSKEQASEVLKALDNAIAKGPWDKSNFLRMIGKNLQNVREKFASRANSTGAYEKAVSSPTIPQRFGLRANQIEVYISLYSADGGNLQTWERILVNLPTQMVSRPIYADEEDAKAFIRSKENKNNEAYVAIYIRQDDILSVAAEKTPVDKLGKPLLSLKGKALELANINRFVHKTGLYHFRQGRLQKYASGD